MYIYARIGPLESLLAKTASMDYPLIVLPVAGD